MAPSASAAVGRPPSPAASKSDAPAVVLRGDVPEADGSPLWVRASLLPDALAVQTLVSPLAQRGDAEANQILADTHSVCAVEVGFTGEAWVREWLQRYCHGFHAWPPVLEHAERDAVIGQSTEALTLAQLQHSLDTGGAVAAVDDALAIILEDERPAAVRTALEWAAERGLAVFPLPQDRFVGSAHAKGVNAAASVQLYCALSGGCLPASAYSVRACIVLGGCTAPRSAVDVARAHYSPVVWNEAQRHVSVILDARGQQRP